VPVPALPVLSRSALTVRYERAAPHGISAVATVSSFSNPFAGSSAYEPSGRRTIATPACGPGSSPEPRSLASGSDRTYRAAPRRCRRATNRHPAPRRCGRRAVHLRPRRATRQNSSAAGDPLRECRVRRTWVRLVAERRAFAISVAYAPHVPGVGRDVDFRFAAVVEAHEGDRAGAATLRSRRRTRSPASDHRRDVAHTARARKPERCGSRVSRRRPHAARAPARSRRLAEKRPGLPRSAHAIRSRLGRGNVTLRASSAADGGLTVGPANAPE